MNHFWPFPSSQRVSLYQKPEVSLWEIYIAIARCLVYCDMCNGPDIIYIVYIYNMGYVHPMPWESRI